MKTYDEIIAEIEESLSNVSLDNQQEVVKELLKKYRKHPLYEEIKDASFSLLNENKEASNNNEEDIENSQNEISGENLDEYLINEYNGILNILGASSPTVIIEKLKKLIIIIENNYKGEYLYSPNNIVEEMLIRSKYKKHKFIYSNVNLIYSMLGEQYLITNKFKKAEEFLQKARKWNPYAPSFLFNYVALAGKKKDSKEYRKRIKEIYPFIYDPNDLGLYYKINYTVKMQDGKSKEAIYCLRYARFFASGKNYEDIDAELYSLALDLSRNKFNYEIYKPEEYQEDKKHIKDIGVPTFISAEICNTLFSHVDHKELAKLSKNEENFTYYSNLISIYDKFIEMDN